ncbi:S1C family serine protease [Aquibacillus kalidii]|uniref:S1C family serine protease n=1 Tax=Aquibacillus kalidii TaxID=2762597 RepID=UPI0016445D9D|nr:S1C family serine protease [Aquibacillus kalidii]
MSDWLIEFAKGVGKLFLNPLFYWFFILTFLVSLSRIKNERKNFGTKIFDVYYEAAYTWPVSLISGAILSVLAVGLGVTFDYTVIALLSLVTILLSVSGRFSWLSAAYSFGFTYLLLLIFPSVLDNVLPSEWQENFKNVEFVSFTTLLGLMIMVEAVLVLQIRKRETFPELVKGNRGKWVGQHRLKKITMIPFFGLVPSGLITPFADWWPMFSINGESYGILLIPIVIGFEHVAKGALPIKVTRALGQSLLILGLATIALSIIGYYLPIFTLISVIVALIGREWLSFHFRSKDQQNQPFFSPDQTGLLVLGVIPGTPAESLKLSVGEKILKVNGIRVANEQQFYEALQANSAYCKLDIRDERGEIRFAQRALYQGEHHELGILFAKKQYRITTKEQKTAQKN